jgi:hypothetical protein
LHALAKALLGKASIRAVSIEALICSSTGAEPAPPKTEFQLTAGLVKAQMAELAKRFPKGIEYSIKYDPTVFVSQSIDAVYETLRDAIILVVIVVLVFLQSWRTA